MNPATLMLVLKAIDVLSVALPQLMDTLAHYQSLKDDPNLSETDKKRMVANLEALQLKDWDQL